MKKLILAFLAGLVVMAGGGYLLQQRQPDPTVAKDEPPSKIDGGIFRKSETVAVGELLNSIRRLNRLVVFQAYVTATTKTRETGPLTQTNQTMLTPAYVNYYIELDSLNKDSIRIEGKDVYVASPKLMIERPNIDTSQVQIFNGGIWSSLTSVSERLRVANSSMALKQLYLRAKMPFLVLAAQKAAADAQELNIRRILVASGYGDMNVHVGQ
ncbi:DUF4230 domain-containing protein [Sphingomonas qilianensis]|uniref:DUF4230 domain-containing protein n=1 Tax=Sphingomonas qilianensis TaxID=1736690 RepID=A0ABU9XSD9_9SPHN